MAVASHPPSLLSPHHPISLFSILPQFLLRPECIMNEVLPPFLLSILFPHFQRKPLCRARAQQNFPKVIRAPKSCTLGQCGTIYSAADGTAAVLSEFYPKISRGDIPCNDNCNGAVGAVLLLLVRPSRRNDCGAKFNRLIWKLVAVNPAARRRRRRRDLGDCGTAAAVVLFLRQARNGLKQDESAVGRTTGPGVQLSPRRRHQAKPNFASRRRAAPSSAYFAAHLYSGWNFA